MTTFDEKPPTDDQVEFRNSLVAFLTAWADQISIEDRIAITAHVIGQFILYCPNDIVPSEHMKAFVLENMVAGNRHGLAAAHRAAGGLQ